MENKSSEVSNNLKGLDTFDLGYAAAKKELESELSALRKELEEAKKSVYVEAQNTVRIANELAEYSIREGKLLRENSELTAERDRLAAQIKEAGEQEPVAEVVADETPEGTVKWLICVGYPLKSGDKLYRNPPIHEGWVMVPLEPTREMLDAAHQDFWSGKELDKLLKDAYRLMLSAVKKDTNNR